MLYKTRAIVLNYIKYRDTSIIARFYTREFGIQSYIVNRIRVKNSRYKMAHFQPFTLLELVCYHNEKKDIQRISEIRMSEVHHQISFDINRSGIALFLTEILVKVLREEHADYELYDFLHRSIICLDMVKEGVNHFHVQFLLKLGKYLGMMPSEASEILSEARSLIQSKDMLSGQKLQELLDTDYGKQIKLTKTEKNTLFELVVQMYKLHFENLKEIKSLAVLKEVMG